MHCLDALFQDGTILRVNSLRASIKAARRSIRGGCAPQYLVRHLDSVAAAAHEHKENRAILKKSIEAMHEVLWACGMLSGTKAATTCLFSTSAIVTVVMAANARQKCIHSVLSICLGEYKTPRNWRAAPGARQQILVSMNPSQRLTSSFAGIASPTRAANFQGNAVTTTEPVRKLASITHER